MGKFDYEKGDLTFHWSDKIVIDILTNRITYKILKSKVTPCLNVNAVYKVLAKTDQGDRAFIVYLNGEEDKAEEIDLKTAADKKIGELEF